MKRKVPNLKDLDKEKKDKTERSSEKMLKLPKIRCRSRSGT